jgi:hypothetical protein
MTDLNNIENLNVPEEVVKDLPELINIPANIPEIQPLEKVNESEAKPPVDDASFASVTETEPLTEEAPSTGYAIIIDGQGITPDQLEAIHRKLRNENLPENQA